MQKEIKVRRCEGGDEEAYVRLNLEFMAEVKQDNAYWSALEAPSVGQLRRVFAEILERPESVQVFVAEVDGAVVAYANAYTAYSVWSMGAALTIDDLYVEARHRGLGVGRAVMTHLESFARENGYRRLQLHTEMTNTTAQTLYRSLGFEAEDMKYFMKRLPGPPGA